jgi:hypothetical protein
VADTCRNHIEECSQVSTSDTEAVQGVVDTRRDRSRGILPYSDTWPLTEVGDGPPLEDPRLPGCATSARPHARADSACTPSPTCRTPAVLLRHLAPRRAAAQHRQDAIQHGTVVMTWTPCRRALRREQRQEALPFGVRKRPSHHDRCDRGRTSAPGTGALLPAHALCSLGGVTAGGHRLVGASPLRPAQAEGPPLLRFAQRQDPPTDFRHGERDACGGG